MYLYKWGACCFSKGLSFLLRRSVIHVLAQIFYLLAQRAQADINHIDFKQSHAPTRLIMIVIECLLEPSLQ